MECDEQAKDFAKKIKAQVEEKIGIKLPIYEPIGFKRELKGEEENYVIKIHIGEQKYIHISSLTSLKDQNEDNAKLTVIQGKSLNDTL